jgi:hypothetical protein
MLIVYLIEYVYLFRYDRLDAGRKKRHADTRARRA